MEKFYFDTAIIRDYYENREDRFRPLGEWAFRLLAMIKANGFTLIISDMVLKELRSFYSKEEISKILTPFNKIIEKVDSNEGQYKEARKIANERKLPLLDALHAIIARDTNSIMITRDKHFLELTDITQYKKPEDII